MKFFLGFLYLLIFVHSNENDLIKKSLKNWRCPGEMCDKESLCLGSSCVCQLINKQYCYCRITEFNDLNTLDWNNKTKVCIGYLEVNQECQHSNFCESRNCENVNGKTICVVERKRKLQPISNPPSGGPTLSGGPPPSGGPKYNGGPKDNGGPPTNIPRKCQNSLDCRNNKGCLNGICISWGMECIGQSDCNMGCCDGGYCQTDTYVCNSFKSAITITIIIYVVIGFSILNIIFWFIWYCIGRSKVQTLATVNNEIISNVVKGVPISLPKNSNFELNNLPVIVNDNNTVQVKISKNEKLNNNQEYQMANEENIQNKII